MSIIPHRSGIYCAIHRDSGRMYVGSSVDMRKRMMQHIALANRGGLACFASAIRHHGAESFDWEVILECPKHRLLQMEQFFITLYRSASVDGYNVISKAFSIYERACMPSTRDRISKALSNPTKEVRARMSMAQKGKVFSLETRQKMSDAAKGRKWSQASKEKLRIANVGKTLSVEHRKKISESHKKRSHATLH